MDIGDLRRDYRQRKLERNNLDKNPFEQFKLWLGEAIKSEVLEPNAMILSTATKTGIPSSRTVLLKEIDERGLIFFTNKESRKAKEMIENPEVSLVFWWAPLERQVAIQGKAEQIDKADDENYFTKRPRGNQLGCWASRQGAVISSREILEDEFRRLDELYKDKVPLPPFWGGFRIIPTRFEFWQGRSNRLHDRFMYQKENGSWTICRLSP